MGGVDMYRESLVYVTLPNSVSYFFEMDHILIKKNFEKPKSSSLSFNRRAHSGEIKYYHSNTTVYGLLTG